MERIGVAGPYELWNAPECHAHQPICPCQDTCGLQSIERLGHGGHRAFCFFRDGFMRGEASAAFAIVEHPKQLAQYLKCGAGEGAFMLSWLSVLP